MNVAFQAQLRQFLQQRRAAVATSWYKAIAPDSFPGLDSAAVRHQLFALTDQVMSLLLAGEFTPAEVRPIGAELAELQCVRSEAFGRTLEVLAGELVSGLPAEALVALQPRLASLVGELTVGFLKQRHATILAEQDAIYRALIAAQQEIEEARRATEARYQVVTTLASEGIILADASTRCILEANPAFHRLLGYREGELRGISLYEVIAHDRASIDEGIQRTLQQGQRTVGRRRCRRKDGTMVAVDAGAAAIAAARTTLLSIVVHGITDQIGAVNWRHNLVLTERDRLLLELLEKGYDDVHIARELRLSKQTVRNYLSRLYTTLGVCSRLEAVAWAHDHHLMPRLPG